MYKEANTRGAMPLELLIQFWEKHLGEDDELNPPNPLGEVIQDTIYHLKELGYRKPLDRPGLRDIQRLWCQHCKAMQKTNNTVVECWYNPLDHGRENAFCAANEDACKAILALIRNGGD